MDYARFDDLALLKMITRRQQDALSELYDRYSRLVYSIAVQMLDDPAKAEEVTLDVFTRVWERADQYQPTRASVKTWLVRMARNGAIDRLRRAGVRPESRSVALSDMLTMLASGDAAPDREVERSLQAEGVRHALEKLPEEQAQVIIMAYYLGYSQRQIASELDMPVGTVKTRTRLAMDKLRTLLVADHR